MIGKLLQKYIMQNKLSLTFQIIDKIQKEFQTFQNKISMLATKNSNYFLSILFHFCTCQNYSVQAFFIVTDIMNSEYHSLALS